MEEHNPYNPLNTEITLNEVQSILKKYGISPKINSMVLFKRAFIHKSYTRSVISDDQVLATNNGCIPLSSKSNERLEFLGDGVLELVTKFYLYRRFPNENEGFMTEKKISIVKNETIGNIAYEMGLHKWFIISQYAEEKKMRTNLKKLGCLFEAFIGALFLDCNQINVESEWSQFVTGPGFQIVQVFIEKIFEKHIDWTALLINDDNYKNILQVKLQKEFKVTPHYIELSYDDFGFEMGVFLCIGDSIHYQNPLNAIEIDNFKNYSEIHDYLKENKKVFICLGKGQHKIKRKAEQIACQQIIEKGW
uniref:RNase III domain-containing protein n=1 Tax=viral metagenome TaxID=1070528 RepID=A0A6C0HSG6_9ZZZZ